MKRIITILLVLVCGWYGVVIFFLPKITHCGDSASTLVVHSSIDQFAREVCQGTRRFDDFDLNLFENWRYRARFVGSGGDPKYAVVVYPEVPWKYRKGLLHRVLFLDSERSSIPLIILTREGDFLSCQKHDYSFKNVPPDSVLQSMDVRNPAWTMRWNIRELVDEPCVPIDENSKSE